MSLPNILLSLLREPMSGTDLIRLFRGTINHFWSTDLSQIYRALDELERQGCVKPRNVPNARGPARKVYRLTAKGTRSLAAWVRQEPKVPPAKFEYLAQVFSVTATESPKQEAQRLLEKMRDDARRYLAILEPIEARMKTEEPEAMPSRLFYPWLTLRHGLRRRRFLLEWIEESLALLERRSDELDRSTTDKAPDSIEELLRITQEITGDLALADDKGQAPHEENES